MACDGRGGIAVGSAGLVLQQRLRFEPFQRGEEIEWETGLAGGAGILFENEVEHLRRGLGVALLGQQ